MQRFLVAAVTAFALPAAAAAVTVTGLSAPGPNLVAVSFDGGDLLGLDYSLFNSAPVTARLGRAGGGSFGFNAYVETFAGLEQGRNLRQLTLTLDGASFSGAGTVGGAFSTAVAMVSPDGRVLRVRFDPAGEGLAATIGNVFEGADWTVSMEGDAASLVLQGAVPEPGTWAMLVAGFGIVGWAARRRRPLARA